MAYIKNMKKIKFYSLFLFILISACGPYWYKPYGRLFTRVPQGGSPGFNLGWKHGCESGLATQFGGAFYMAFYSWHKDPDIASSNPNIDKIKNRYKDELKNVNWNNFAEVSSNLRDYNSVFGLSYNYCRQSALGMLQTAGMNPTLASDNPRFDPGLHNLGSLYKIDGKGDSRFQLW